MANIIEKVLHSKKREEPLPPTWLEKPFVQILFEIINNDSRNDRKWLLDTDTDESLTVNEIEMKSINVAEVLRENDLKKGDVVHIIVPNCIHFHTTVFGVWLLGKH